MSKPSFPQFVRVVDPSKPDRKLWDPSVYALIDPRTGLIRYVGMSVNPAARFAGHMSTPVISIRAWIQELQALGLTPRMAVLERVSEPRWNYAEGEWIRTCRENGCDLLNRSPGGVGWKTIRQLEFGSGPMRAAIGRWRAMGSSWGS